MGAPAAATIENEEGVVSEMTYNATLILLTAITVVIVIPGLILAIIEGCFGRGQPGKEKR